MRLETLLLDGRSADLLQTFAQTFVIQPQTFAIETIAHSCDMNNLVFQEQSMATNNRWDLNSLFLVTWIVGVSAISIAIFITSPSIGRSIERQVTIESSDPQLDQSLSPLLTTLRGELGVKTRYVQKLSPPQFIEQTYLRKLN